MQSYSTLLLAVLVIISAHVSAKCNKFAQVGHSYLESDRSQLQIISDGMVCDEKAPTWGTVLYPGRYEKPGCILYPEGFVTATGSTNLSISATEAEPLYTLVSQSYNSSLIAALSEKTLFSSLGGCLDSYVSSVGLLQWSPMSIIRPGFAGYLQFIPTLMCVHGSLEDCSNDAPVKNGTGLKLCGVVNTVISNYSANAPEYLKRLPHYGPMPLYDWAHDLFSTNATYAATVKNQAKAANVTCSNLGPYWQLHPPEATQTTRIITTSASCTASIPHSRSSSANELQITKNLLALPVGLMFMWATLGVL